MTTTPLNTPADLLVAYLRGELNEADFRTKWGEFGRTTISLDEAATAQGFSLKFPEDMIEVVYSPESTADVIAKLNEETPPVDPPPEEDSKKADSKHETKK